MIRQYEEENNIPPCFLVVTDQCNHPYKHEMEYFRTVGVNCVETRPVRLGPTSKTVLKVKERQVRVERGDDLSNVSGSRFGNDWTMTDTKVPFPQCHKISCRK